jgi:hypothetical protein
MTSERYTPEQILDELRQEAENCDRRVLNYRTWGQREASDAQKRRAAIFRQAADQLAAQSAPPTPGEREFLHGLLEQAESLISPEDYPDLVASIDAVLTPCDEANDGHSGPCVPFPAQAGGDPPPTTTGSKAWCYAHGAWCWTHPVERKNILCRFDIPAPPQKGETP